MTGPQSQGLIAQGPLPAGMLRIQQGHQERYVWPVHLPGWLALGWRVAGAEATAAKPLLPGVMAPAPAAVLELIPESSASSAGCRHRRRCPDAARRVAWSTMASIVCSQP